MTIDLLFALSEDMKSNPLVPFGMFAYFDEKTKTGLPVSTPYWLKIREYMENNKKQNNGSYSRFCSLVG